TVLENRLSARSKSMVSWQTCVPSRNPCHISAVVSPCFCHGRMIGLRVGVRIMLMTKPTVILIGADRGGVGKTTVARTLLDYFNVQKMRVRAFDTEFPKGNLKRFHPDLTEVVDFTSVDTQITIFDPLEAPVVPVTVIDVRAGLMSDMLRTLHDIGFIAAVKRNEVALVLF